MDSIKDLHSKWDRIFDVKEWVAFKPALGTYVYPCYSCKYLFSSKKSFLDHINRRAVLLKFTCPDCDNMVMTFYNRCLFLLHCRKHYHVQKGKVNLKNLEVSALPMGLFGFFKVPEIPYLFDVEEDLIADDGFMNSQFYIPNPEDKGKEIVRLRPTNLVIDRTTPNGDVQSLALKQVAKNIPKCQFITLQAYKEIQANMAALNQSSVDEVKNETPEEVTFRSWETVENRVSTSDSASDSDLLFISEPSEPEEETNPLLLVKVETVVDEQTICLDNGEESNSSSLDQCSECKTPVHDSLQSHFLGDNKPSEVTLRCLSCRLIAPTLCSFQAHERLHSQQAPYVCPDCGIEFAAKPEFLQHLENVCYHTAKSVRIKCPGRRCGKVFASEATFGLHFRQAHVHSFYLCGTCETAFNSLQECEEHCQMHEKRESDFEKFYTCPGCTQDAMTTSAIKKHIENHCNNLCRYIYIYMCKYCKGYFRSLQTMSNHANNCKVHKHGLPARARSNPSALSNSKFVSSKYASGKCKSCSTKIIFPNNKPISYCKKCISKPNQNSTTSKWYCPLCKDFIDLTDKEKHMIECKFSSPRIVLEKLDMEKILGQTQNENSSNVSGLDDITLTRKARKSDSSPDENRPRKRLRFIKPKKPEIIHDLTAEEAIQFDGIYHCHLCDFTESERAAFHDHIKNHRTIKTYYQCMECGECFIVKPSLIKHLLHYHHIANLEKYFQENDCFDEEAVNELAKLSKAPYLANIVQANQCRVCLEQFNSAEEHDNHFRIHGMAFLMKSSI